MSRHAPATLTKFQSTLPLRGATLLRGRNGDAVFISIHTPLAGSDRDEGITDRAIDISIHTPLAGSDWRSRNSNRARKYFNPHSPCGERLASCRPAVKPWDISIHTPLAGSDGCNMIAQEPYLRFQSTLPLRGATALRVGMVGQHKFQSTLPLRGATAEMRHF